MSDLHEKRWGQSLKERHPKPYRSKTYNIYQRENNEPGFRELAVHSMAGVKVKLTKIFLTQTFLSMAYGINWMTFLTEN